MTERSIDDLEAERAERGITQPNMSALVGYSGNNSWGTAVRRGHMSDGKREKAVWVFRYRGECGIVPTPSQVERAFSNTQSTPTDPSSFDVCDVA